MEERLSRPLPELQLLPHDHDQGTLEGSASDAGPLTTPRITNDTAIVIQWQAAQLLNKIDQNALVKLIPRISGSFCEIDRIPIIKSYMNMLLLLHEKDSEKQWIARIPYHQEDERFLVDQVEPLLRASKRFKTFRCPRLYHYGLAKDEKNSLGVDFMLLDFIDGRQMPMWTETFPILKQKGHVLDQIADAYMEMFSKPATYEGRLVLKNANRSEELSKEDFHAYDLPPTMTTSLYLHYLADRAIKARIKMLLSHHDFFAEGKSRKSLGQAFADLLVLFMMRTVIPDYVLGRYNDSPFYISHPDLHNRNIVIEGRPMPEEYLQSPPAQPRARGFASTGDHPVVIQTATAFARGRAPSIAKPEQKPDDLKVVGLIDWDTAHPIPLQAAAILPKFLETLPGAEFPDLPVDYVEPNLSREKEMFLEILREKEQEKNGNTLVSDLIWHGGWERDIFTVALRRGDVRARWLEWWKKQQSSRRWNNSDGQYSWVQKDLDNMWGGLCGFLRKGENRQAVENEGTSFLMWMVVLELERLEEVATDACWADVASTEVELVMR